MAVISDNATISYLPLLAWIDSLQTHISLSLLPRHCMVSEVITTTRAFPVFHRFVAATVGNSLNTHHGITPSYLQGLGFLGSCHFCFEIVVGSNDRHLIFLGVNRIQWIFERNQIDRCSGKYFFGRKRFSNNTGTPCIRRKRLIKIT